MRKLYCDVEWKFQKELPEWLKDYCERKFLKMRSELIDIFNAGVTDTLNTYFNTYHNGNGYEEEYMNYMRTNYQKVCDRYNENRRFNIIKLYIRDDCDIGGILRPLNTKFDMFISNLREKP